MLLLAGLFALWPGVASAQYEWYEWLQELSGPGPFSGTGADWRLLCFSDDAPAPNESPLITPSCLLTPLQRDQFRRASINLAFAYLDANGNPLKYAAGLDPAVKLTLLKPSVWWRPFPAFEVGTGAGIMWFSGPAFPSFTRFFVEPFRVDVKLSALSHPFPEYQTWMEAVSFRWGVAFIPGGFLAEDFGAIPGSFQSSRDAIHSFTISIELDPIIRHWVRTRRSGGR
jgi:hypothetical protein